MHRSLIGSYNDKQSYQQLIIYNMHFHIDLKGGNPSTTFSDLQALATSLQETVTDKNTALLHQRRTNR